APQQIERAEEKLFQLAEQGASETGFRDFKSAVIGAIEMATAAYKRDGAIVGVPTGFTDVDKLLGGLHDSDLVIIAGRPSMGNTAFATNVASNAASTKTCIDGPDGTEIDQYETVAFFSLEMSAEQLATRIISEQAHVRSDAIRRGDVREEEYH